MYTLLPVALPLILWLFFRLALPAGPYEMDHGNGSKPGTFFLLLILYQVFVYILIGLSLYGANWAFKYTGNLVACIVFLVAALCSLLFAGLTLNKYALSLSLGFSSVALLVYGVVLTALEVGR